MPSHVGGPFIEFNCSKCGRYVQMNADMEREKVRDMIVEINNDLKKRRCARCGDKD